MQLFIFFQYSKPTTRRMVCYVNNRVFIFYLNINRCCFANLCCIKKYVVIIYENVPVLSPTANMEGLNGCQAIERTSDINL